MIISRENWIFLVLSIFVTLISGNRAHANATIYEVTREYKMHDPTITLSLSFLDIIMNTIAS